ncbi:glycerol-3-phosphate 1-O-acyltransferase PlsY [Uliginosibacterium sp. sgz301328]|uniref:glycerol-3-phosphate 1-O-acyltransferase PlsY n=1 Tax=Uliginosibacterium sp. sgz301328 TaxID=3243764 RepID=UPI00359E7757
MTATSTSILALLAAYLIGSIPFAVIVSLALGISDPRSYGSGNPGATNVLRSGNKFAALLTLVGDAGKGWLVVWGAKALVAHGIFALSPRLLAGMAIAAFLGHVFSVFLRFKGGKGVATAAGVLFGIHWLVGLGTLAVWIAVAAMSRYSSAAALTAAVAAPALAHFVLGDPLWVGTTIVLAAVLIWRHAENIRRLLNGTESKLGKKKEAISR